MSVQAGAAREAEDVAKLSSDGVVRLSSGTPEPDEFLGARATQLPAETLAANVQNVATGLSSIAGPSRTISTGSQRTAVVTELNFNTQAEAEVQKAMNVSFESLGASSERSQAVAARPASVTVNLPNTSALYPHARPLADVLFGPLESESSHSSGALLGATSEVGTVRGADQSKALPYSNVLAAWEHLDK